MNERLLDICIKAGINTWPFNEVGFISLDESELEKFADLIIQECIDCVRGAGLTDEVAVKNNLGFNDGLSAAVVNVQKHFGVEQ